MKSFFSPATPSEETSEDLVWSQLLSSEFNPVHADEFGLDPWGLRVISPKPSEAFDTLIKRCTLNKENISFDALITHDPKNEKEVPARIFIIWLGSAFDEGLEGIRDLVKAWRERNPHHCISLVTDQLSTSNYDRLSQSNQHASEMIEWCNTHQICIVNYKDMVTSHPLLEQGLLYKNFGFASDILRLLLLKEFGCTYADIDLVAKLLTPPIILEKPLALCRSGIIKKIKTRTLLSKPEQRIFDIQQEMNSGSKYIIRSLPSMANKNDFSNDFMMSPVKNPETTLLINNMLDNITSRVKMPIETLFKTHGLMSFPEWLYPEYDTKIHCGFIKDIKQYYTMITSGPNTLETFRNLCDDIGVYESYFLCSWLRKYHALTEESTSESIKRIVTCILFDLCYEPKVLRLNKYLSSMGKLHVAKGVATILSKHFSDQLRNVDYIIFGEYTDYASPENSQWLINFTGIINCAQLLKINNTLSADICITDECGKACITNADLQEVLSTLTKSEEDVATLLSHLSYNDITSSHSRQ